MRQTLRRFEQHSKIAVRKRGRVSRGRGDDVENVQRVTEKIFGTDSQIAVQMAADGSGVAANQSVPVFPASRLDPAPPKSR
eukprot:gene6511-3150_t